MGRRNIALTMKLLVGLVSSVAAQAGWYFADPNVSCNQKCTEVGVAFQSERTDLVCTQANFEVAVDNLMNSAGFPGCTSYNDQTTQGQPPMRTNSGECIYRSGGSQNGDQSGTDSQRICCCSTSPLVDCPLKEISSCSQCALAQFLPSYDAVCQNNACQDAQTLNQDTLECECDDPLASVNATTGLCWYPAKNFTINCDDPGEIIDETFPPDQGEKIKEHGCHCTKLSVLSIVENYVGGAGKVDNIDNQCKDWFEARRCTQLNSCRGFNLADYDYTLVIEGQSHVAYCEQLFELGYTPEEEQCLYDICIIDSTYAINILYSLEDIYVDWDSIIVTEDMCPHCEYPQPCIGTRECTGTPPLYQ